jgi:hypothetical protein
LRVYPVCHFAVCCYTLFRPNPASLLIRCGKRNQYSLKLAGKRRLGLSTATAHSESVCYTQLEPT